ncbi:HAD family hydrolase [Micromonospora sp. NPDC007208]|uniref:HAD family hydrolase n=1 Tax=Micromonospora sp. NPDC007208 TaxID=3364236 RepID=UPI00367D9B7A
MSCIFFDFFGTLVNYSPSRTEQGFHESHALLRKLGVEIGYAEFLNEWSIESTRFDEMTRVNNREFSMEDVTAAFLGRLLKGDPGSDTVARFVDVYLVEWNRGVTYRPDVPGIIETLAERFRLAVVTNTHKADLVPRHLAAMGISGLFETVVTSLEVGWRKPHPAIFAEALRQMRTDGADVLFVGDDYTADYLGSVAAGIKVFLIDPGRRFTIPEEHRLESLGQVLVKLPPLR